MHTQISCLPGFIQVMNNQITLIKTFSSFSFPLGWSSSDKKYECRKQKFKNRSNYSGTGRILKASWRFAFLYVLSQKETKISHFKSHFFFFFKFLLIRIPLCIFVVCCCSKSFHMDSLSLGGRWHWAGFWACDLVIVYRELFSKYR